MTILLGKGIQLFTVYVLFKSKFVVPFSILVDTNEQLL